MNISLYVTPIKSTSHVEFPATASTAKSSSERCERHWGQAEHHKQSGDSTISWSYYDDITIQVLWFNFIMILFFMVISPITIQLVMMYENCPPSALSWPLQDILRERMTGERRGLQQIGGRRGRSGRRVSGNIILSLSVLWWQGFFSSCP